MEIQSQSPFAASAANATPSVSQPESAGSALSSDFETFLKMLTVQMENQDPLNPVESSDFAVQLATFSGVEQQIRTNGLLEDMATGQGASGLAQLAGWVGMEARVTGSAAFAGTPITIAPSPDPASDAAYLVVRNASGDVVSREGVPINANTLDWAGVDVSGAPLPAGNYTFELESLNQGTISSVKPVDHYALVTEARLGDAGVDIVLAGGGTVPSAQVSALRTPPGTN